VSEPNEAEGCLEHAVEAPAQQLAVFALAVERMIGPLRPEHEIVEAAMRPRPGEKDLIPEIDIDDQRPFPFGPAQPLGQRLAEIALGEPWAKGGRPSGADPAANLGRGVDAAVVHQYELQGSGAYGAIEVWGNPFCRRPQFAGFVEDRHDH